MVWVNYWVFFHWIFDIGWVLPKMWKSLFHFQQWLFLREDFCCNISSFCTESNLLCWRWQKVALIENQWRSVKMKKVCCRGRRKVSAQQLSSPHRSAPASSQDWKSSKIKQTSKQSIYLSIPDIPWTPHQVSLIHPRDIPETVVVYCLRLWVHGELTKK